MRRCAPGRCLRAVQPVRDRLVEHLVDERRLARARHAGHAAERRRAGPSTSTSLEVVLRRAHDLDVAGRRAPLRRHLDPCACPTRNWPVSDSSTCIDLARPCPAATIWPPCSPAPGPMSTRWSAARIVSSSCSTTSTVLPRSRSRSQRPDQLRVVALVQADRRLVEDVEHADQRRADLRRQADPLRLAARQRRRRAVHRQVADADVLQERSRSSISRRISRAIVALGLATARARRATRARAAPTARRTRGSPSPPTEHRPRLGPQPRAVALRARPQRHVLLDLLARPLGVGLLVAALEVGDDPLEARRVRALAARSGCGRRRGPGRRWCRTGRGRCCSCGRSSHGVSRSTS